MRISSWVKISYGATYRVAKTSCGAFTFLFILLTVFTIGCGAAKISSSTASSSSFSDDSDDSSSSSSEVLAGNISTLQVNGSSLELTLDDVSDDEDVLVVLYHYDELSSTQAFQVGSSSASFLVANENEDVTEDFHQLLRIFEGQIEEEDQYTNLNSSTQYLMYATTVGSEKTFKVLNSISSANDYDTVTATLRYANDNFEFYVDNRNAGSVTDEELEDLADDFFVDDERDLFGTESDMDGDGKFAVLFTQEVNELGGSFGGIITGFFYAVDLFSESLFPVSNEMEVFYTLVPDPDGDFGITLPKSYVMSNVYSTVLHHEFQHMINFNRHYFINGGSAETSWLNEGLAHLAEDMMNINSDDYMAESSVDNPSRVGTYLSDIQNICFTCGSSLSQRGGSYLFLRYIYEQSELGNIDGIADGASFIDNALDTNLTGLDNLVDTLFGSSGSEDDLKALLGKFTLAVYLSNTGSSTDDRFNFQGINLRSVQNDNRGTVLDGPAVQSISSLSFTDTLQGTAFTYLQVSGEVINDNGGILNFTFADGSDFGGYIIREN